MAVRRPTLEQLRSVAEDLGMHMGEEELKSYDALMQANYAAYDAVDANVKAGLLVDPALGRLDDGLAEVHGAAG